MKMSNHRLHLALLIVLLLVISSQLHAGSQWDITLSVPYYAGVKSSDGNVGEFSNYLFLVPDVQWHYYWGSDKFHFGPGVRLFTLVIESAIYPIFSLESVLGGFVINAQFGGGVFLLFGLHNQAAAEVLFLPEISVAYRFGKKKRFSVGTAAMFVVASDEIINNGFAFIGTGFVRWTF